MKKLAIITTHPIQYNAPWFKLLAERSIIDIKVFYTWGQLQNKAKYDPGFGTNVEWDIPLLNGYEYTFVENTSPVPGSHHFKGINNPTLVEEIEKWNPEAILVFGWSFKSHLKVLRHFKGKRKLLFRGDSTLLDEQPGFSLQKLARRIFLKWIYSHIDTALYVGTENKKYYRAHGLKDRQLINAPHAIDNDRFRHEKGDLRNELGISPDQTVFVFAGKFENKKDPQLLLDSFIKLRDPSSSLVLVGNGPLENELRSTARGVSGKFDDNIHFLPFHNQLKMPAVYRTADVFVLPSRGPGETWGLAVNEAMACSRAVLVSDKCGCATDLVQHGGNGYIFTGGNTAALLEKLGMLLSERKKIAAMGRRSAEIIQNSSFEKICIAIEEIVLFN